MRRHRHQNLNGLWMARKKAGLGQKSVAKLLGHATTSTISEYETGRNLPNLRTALKLAAIYQTPVTDLYAPLCHQIESEIQIARLALLTPKPNYSRIPHHL